VPRAECDAGELADTVLDLCAQADRPRADAPVGHREPAISSDNPGGQGTPLGPGPGGATHTAAHTIRRCPGHPLDWFHPGRDLPALGLRFRSRQSTGGQLEPPPRAGSRRGRLLRLHLLRVCPLGHLHTLHSAFELVLDGPVLTVEALVGVLPLLVTSSPQGSP